MLMIEQVRLTDRAGEFRNRPRITHFDALFARSYFDAFDNWRNGRGVVPAAWAIAFDVADRRSARGLGDLLLGLNAHISRDLAYAVAEGFRGSSLAMDPDYQLISRLVEQLTPRALADISTRFDPAVAAAGLPLAVSGGRKSLGALVVAWTAQSWRNGTALRNAAPAARAAIQRHIESLGLRRARAIAAAMRYLTPLGFRKRDAYCAAQRRKGSVSGAPQPAQGSGAKADPTLLCDLSVRCTALVSRWARIEGLRGRAVIGAKSFYLNGCLGCHRYLGDGRTRFAAPDLTAEGRRNRGVEWQIELLRCPSCVLAGIPMPRAPFFGIRDVAIFLEASKGPARR
jgi:Family of unknown function (DUF5995)